MRASQKKRPPLQADPGGRPVEPNSDREQSPRRSTFACLKLSRGIAAEAPRWGRVHNRPRSHSERRQTEARSLPA